MKNKITAAILSSVIALGMLAGCGAKKEEDGKQGEWTPVTVTDDLGREVTIVTEPKNTMTKAVTMRQP